MSNTNKVKNAFDGLISRLDTIEKETETLKLEEWKFSRLKQKRKQNELKQQQWRNLLRI